MLKKKTNKKGFTLIELIVVIAVIAILAAVLLPRFTGFSESSKKSGVLSDAKNIAKAYEAITIQSGTIPADSATVDSDVTIMAYIGNTLGGDLDVTATGFTYTKLVNGKYYSVTYTYDGQVLGNVTDGDTAVPPEYSVTPISGDDLGK